MLRVPDVASLAPLQGSGPAGTAAVPAEATGTGGSEGPNQTCSECGAVQRTVQGSQVGLRTAIPWPQFLHF